MQKYIWRFSLIWLVAVAVLPVHADEPFFEDFETYQDSKTLRTKWSGDEDAQVALETEFAFAGNRALRINLGPTGGNVVCRFERHQDWTKFDTLSFYVYTRDNDLFLNLKYDLIGSDSQVLATDGISLQKKANRWHVVSIGLDAFKDRKSVSGLRFEFASGDVQSPKKAASPVYLDDFSVSRVARWRPAIRRFQDSDRQQRPELGSVLFVGSSSIRMWDTSRWLPELKVLNRGFGGSQTSDVNHYAEEIVFRYRPKLIVFYCGDNDIAGGKDAGRVLNDFRAFVDRVHRRMPRSQIIYLPIKPSLARWKLWPEMQKANELIRTLAASRKNLNYSDTATPMLGEDGLPRPELFLKDGLHLNEDGYRLWTEILSTNLSFEI